MLIKGLENQQNQCKVQELKARLQALQQEIELMQTLMSPHIVAATQSLPTLDLECSSSVNTASKVAVQKTIKVIRCLCVSYNNNNNDFIAVIQ